MLYPARVPRMLSFFSSFATYVECESICESSERQISKLSNFMLYETLLSVIQRASPACSASFRPSQQSSERQISKLSNAQ